MALLLRGRVFVALACVSGVGVSAFGCRSATDVTLVVLTDLPCASHGGTSITVGPRGGTESRPPAAETTTCVDGRIGSLVVVPSGAKDAGLDVRIVTGIGAMSPAECIANGYASKGCILARRSLSYVPHEGLVVSITMRAACEAVDCGMTGTCVRGVCASSSIDPESCASAAGCDESGLVPDGDGGIASDANVTPIADASARDASRADGSIDGGTPIVDAGASDGALPTKCADLTGVVGYNPLNDHCYWSPPGGAVSAQSALAACTKRNTPKEHPVSITTKAENDFVNGMPVPLHWIGLYKSSGGGTQSKADYRWTTQEPVTYDGWAPTFPSGPGTCAIMRNGGFWESASCDALSPVFCERD